MDNRDLIYKMVNGLPPQIHKPIEVGSERWHDQQRIKTLEAELAESEQRRVTDDSYLKDNKIVELEAKIKTLEAVLDFIDNELMMYEGTSNRVPDDLLSVIRGKISEASE